MKRRVGAIFAVVLVGVGLAACAPMFDGTTPLTFTPIGPLVKVSWPAASETDAGQYVQAYRLRIDGGDPIDIAGTDTSCVLTGLAASTTYDLEITAVNNLGQDSADYGGDVASIGRVVGSYTTPAGVGDPSGVRCVSPADFDGDRLPDLVETNTGEFLGAGSTGSSPIDTDTDGDGIADGDEALGTTAGLDLPAMGTTPTHKDLLVEFDWFADSIECGAHSHRPSVSTINAVSSAYAQGSITNPDGTTGVNFIADWGQGGAFTGGNLIADADGVVGIGAEYDLGSGEFVAHKAANFAANRNGYFRYVISGHDYTNALGSSGVAELVGDDLIVSMGCVQDVANWTAGTIVHELGHVLGLRHGGGDDRNEKPNYPSIMNYAFQFDGVDTTCDGVGDGLITYSRGVNAALNENALIETDGICNGVDKDWNRNGVIDAGPVAADINFDVVRTILTDHDDWSTLNFLGLTDASGAPVGDQQPPAIREQQRPTVGG